MCIRSAQDFKRLLFLQGALLFYKSKDFVKDGKINYENFLFRISNFMLHQITHICLSLFI
jgi:hypothetical protein